MFKVTTLRRGRLDDGGCCCCCCCDDMFRFLLLLWLLNFLLVFRSLLELSITSCCLLLIHIYICAHLSKVYNFFFFFYFFFFFFYIYFCAILSKLYKFFFFFNILLFFFEIINISYYLLKLCKSEIRKMKIIIKFLIFCVCALGFCLRHQKLKKLKKNESRLEFEI